jgi:transcriptional regulator with XRE-family HTH domain
MISPLQCRMARAAVSMSIADLAKASGVREMTVSAFENGADSRRSTIDKLQVTLEAAGATFVSAGEASLAGGQGVRTAT